MDISQRRQALTFSLFEADNMEAELRPHEAADLSRRKCERRVGEFSFQLILRQKAEGTAFARIWRF